MNKCHFNAIEVVFILQKHIWHTLEKRFFMPSYSLWKGIQTHDSINQINIYYCLSYKGWNLNNQSDSYLYG